MDLGCGTGFISMLLADLGFSVEGIDTKLNNSEMIEEFLKRKDLQTKIWKSIEDENENIRFCFYNGIEIPFNN